MFRVLGQQHGRMGWLLLGLSVQAFSCGRIGYEYGPETFDAGPAGNDAGFEVNAAVDARPAVDAGLAVDAAPALDAAPAVDAVSTVDVPWAPDAGTAMEAGLMMEVRPPNDVSGAPIDVTEWLAAGWTPVFSSTFDAPSPAFPTTPVTTCGGFGSLLGGGRVLGFSDAVSVRLTLPAHTQIHVLFDFVAIDSWDAELAFLEVDKRRVTEFRCNKSDPQSCNQRSNQCGSEVSENLDGQVRVSATYAHVAKTADVAIGAILDQGPGDESWGLNNLVVLVR